MSLAAIQQLVSNLVRDDNAKVSNIQRDEAIELALQQYSTDRPRATVEDLTSLGGKVLALPAGWQADFSAIRSLEYPIGNVPPTYIDTDDFSLYQEPDEEVIHLVDGLAAGAEVRSTYTTRHILTALADTIPDKEREPFACLAASVLCDQLAAFYSNRSDSTIQADTVDYQSQAREYRAQAKTYYAKYLNKLGLQEKRSVSSGEVVQLKRDNSFGGPRMFPRSGR